MYLWYSPTTEVGLPQLCNHNQVAQLKQSNKSDLHYFITFTITFFSFLLITPFYCYCYFFLVSCLLSSSSIIKWASNETWTTEWPLQNFLWKLRYLLKRVPNLVIQLPTYCFWHFLQVINITFSELQSRWSPSLILYVSLPSLLAKVFFSSEKCKLRSVFLDNHKISYLFLFPLEPLP